MKGAIIGDIVGSIYEGHRRNIFTKDFPLFSERCRFTDDTVLTCAVADALLRSRKNNLSAAAAFALLTRLLQTYGMRYEGRGYGHHFKSWIYDFDPKPYNSWANGAPMRCSSAGFLAESAESAYRLGELTAAPTHNHPEGMRAAGLTAELIWRARHGESRERLRAVASAAYPLPVLEGIRQCHHFNSSCMSTMPVALAAFFESVDFEDAIRNAISIGGDSDTIAAITGSIAEAYYGVPENIWYRAEPYLDFALLAVVDELYASSAAPPQRLP